MTDVEGATAGKLQRQIVLKIMSYYVLYRTESGVTSVWDKRVSI